MAVFYEQFRTGWLTFEKIGSLEGVMLSAIIIALSSMSSVYHLMLQRVVAGYTVIEIFVLGSAGGALITFLQTLKRTAVVQNGYWLYTALMLLLAIALPFLLTTYQVFAILTLYASLYIGRLMFGHLIDGIERQTDIIVPLAIILSYLLKPNNSVIYPLVAVYLLVMILILIVKTFSVLGIYWVWQNPKI